MTISDSGANALKLVEETVGFADESWSIFI